MTSLSPKPGPFVIGAAAARGPGLPAAGHRGLARWWAAALAASSDSNLSDSDPAPEHAAPVVGGGGGPTPNACLRLLQWYNG